MKKISPALYARSFVEIAEGKTGDGINNSIKKFLAVVKQNNDWRKIPQILRECEDILRKTRGRSLLTIETAREIPRETLDAIKRKFGSGAVDFEEKPAPELVAGVRLTINGTKQLDGSLSHLLNKIFKI